MYFYKDPSFCVVEIDWRGTWKCCIELVSINEDHPRSGRWIAHMLDQIGGRFKDARFIVFKNLTQYKLSVSSTMWNAHVLDNTYTTVFTRKVQDPYPFDATFHNVQVILQKDRYGRWDLNDAFIYSVTLRVRFREERTLITFDPPLMHEANMDDEPVVIVTPTIKLPPKFLVSPPRWNKLRHLEENKFYDTHINGKLMSLRYYMAIPTRPDTGCYKKEVGMFQEYATALRRRADDAASLIQAAFRRAMADPGYRMCVKRLMSEFDALSEY
jgi:hypothetical protein